LQTSHPCPTTVAALKSVVVSNLQSPPPLPCWQWLPHVSCGS
jgi:hypothetical protein